MDHSTIDSKQESRPGTTLSRVTTPFGHFEDERPASKRATRDAVVRLTRLGTPDLEEIARGDGAREKDHLETQSAIASDDALEALLGENTMARSGGRRHRRHQRSGGASEPRPLSGVSRPTSPASAEGAEEKERTPGRPKTPPTPLGPIDNSLLHTNFLATGELAVADMGSRSGLGSASFHTGSADTLPSKARALINRHSYYSAGVRDYDNQRPRDFTVTGELRPERTSRGDKKLFRHRTIRPSHFPDEEEVKLEVGKTDRTGEVERIFKAKQLVKMVISQQGPKSRAQLQRSFRLADKDGSGFLNFDELNFSLRNDYRIKGMTPGDVVRLFKHLDADDSGSVSCAEFVESIESVPLPIFKDKVGYRTMCAPQSLKKRQSFQAWPISFDVGILDHRHKEEKTVIITVRNIGSEELRFRVRVNNLDETKGQRAVVVDQPHGLLASGLRSKVVVSFTAEKAGNINATVSIESRDQLVNVPVFGSVVAEHLFDMAIKEGSRPNSRSHQSREGMASRGSLPSERAAREATSREGRSGSRGPTPRSRERRSRPPTEAVFSNESNASALTSSFVTAAADEWFSHA